MRAELSSRARSVSTRLAPLRKSGISGHGGRLHPVRTGVRARGSVTVCGRGARDGGCARVVSGRGEAGELPAEVVARAAAGFGLLASAARLRLLWALLEGECDVSALAGRTACAVSTASQNLAMLRAGGLVRARREGRRVVYVVDDPDVEAMVRWMVGRPGDAVGGAVAPGRVCDGA
ncbi:MAG: helix-turn-helix transcriptional regulator [Streptomyces sp.]|nr:helix-turn-helix transcriptional regulator [Streptomyces sp.]